MQRRHVIATLAIPMLLLGVGCQSDEELKKVEQQVSDMKVEIFKLRLQMEEANKAATTEYAAAGEARNQDRRFKADLQDTLRQLQDSTRALNNRLGDAPRHTATKAPSVLDTPQAAASSEDEKAFNSVLLDYNRGNYSLAAESLELFLKSYPASSKRPDAFFYLGLSYYNQKTFDKAQMAFETILKNYPSANPFLPAKLKRGQCLLRQGLKPAAIANFKEIIKDFPNTSEARTSQQELSDLGL